MKLKGQADISPRHSCTELIIPIDSLSEAQNWLKSVDVKDGDEITVEVKKKRKKRSLNANAYFWTLTNKLAIALNLPTDEVYRHLVDESGVFTVFEIDDKLKDAFTQGWTEGRSDGWFVKDVGHNLVHAYCGTSVYDTKQMARIIDEVVFECKEQNIETLTDAELERLKNTWRQ